MAAFATVALGAGTVLADPLPPMGPSRVAEVGKPPAAPQADVASLLFSGTQWKQAPAASVITYDYAKKVADASFGPSFDDHVVLTLAAGEGPGSRTAEVRMFSGENAKAAGPFRSDEQNPVLLLVLEENVQELSKSFKANPRYLKNAIRKAWRDHARIEPAQLDIGGKTVAGTRVTVQPFLGDAEANKMKGLESMTYTVDVADAMPGYIVGIDIHAPADGPATFSERLRYGAVKLP